jgi:uncharacterized repeat protein (TIGR01451 family)
MVGTLFGSRPRTTPTRKPYRLLLEPLEDRLTPATPPVIYHVTGTADATLMAGQVTASGANFNAATLRAAVNAANTDGHSGTDTIELPAGHYTLSGSDGPALEISTAVTIQGAGAGVTQVDGGGTAVGALFDRVFLVDSGAFTATFNGITIEGGHPSGGTGGGILNDGANVVLNNDVVTQNFAGAGGGVGNVSNGTLTVKNSVISDNKALLGAGIYNSSSFRPRQVTGTGPTVGVFNSTISGNAAGGEGGGGLFDAGSGLAVITGSTFALNTASGLGSGGAMLLDSFTDVSLVNDTIANNRTLGTGQGGGIFERGSGSNSLSLLNVTLSHNTTPAATAGGNLFIQSGATLALRNTLIAGSDHSGGNLTGSGGAIVNDLGNNLVDATSASDLPLTGPNDLLNVNPGLDPNGLQDNGGPTQTIALLAGSPAIDHASTSVFPPTDQRGVPRPQGAAPDIGAFEFVPPPPPPATPPPPASADLALSMNLFLLPGQTRRRRPPTQFTFEMTITNNGPGTALGALFFEQLPRGLNFVTVVTTQGTFVVAGSFLGVFLGALPPGASAEIFLTVEARHAGRFINTGQVFSQTFDPNLLNNTARLGVNVGLPLFESDLFELLP